MIRIVEHDKGCILSVHAQPGARRNSIVGEHGDALKVAVTAPADKGKANDAVQDVMCRDLGLKRSQVSLLSGPASRAKRFLVIGVSPADLAQRIQALLQDNEDR